MNTKETTGTEVVTIVPQRSVLNTMAERYGMEPKPFEETVLAICMPPNSTRAQFAAFLLVAKEYNLNPLTKEIYAFPARGGGIVPIVSIDGWISLVNSHKACDGFSFSWEQDAEGNPISCTCTMYRKDRAHPVIITEYLAECIRPTDPWKMKHRMLRHKTMIQAARYAFGFSGIYDEDEGAKIAEAREIAAPRQEPPDPPAPPVETQSQVTASAAEDQSQDASETGFDMDDLRIALAGAHTSDEVESAFDEFSPQTALADDSVALEKAFALKKDALARVNRPTEADGQADIFRRDRT